VKLFNTDNFLTSRVSLECCAHYFHPGVATWNYL